MFQIDGSFLSVLIFGAGAGLGTGTVGERLGILILKNSLVEIYPILIESYALCQSGEQIYDL